MAVKGEMEIGSDGSGVFQPGHPRAANQLIADIDSIYR